MTRAELEIVVGKAMEPGQPITTWPERLDTVMRAADLYAAHLITEYRLSLEPAPAGGEPCT